MSSPMERMAPPVQTSDSVQEALSVLLEAARIHASAADRRGALALTKPLAISSPASARTWLAAALLQLGARVEEYRRSPRSLSTSRIGTSVAFDSQGNALVVEPFVGRFRFRRVNESSWNESSPENLAKELGVSVDDEVSFLGVVPTLPFRLNGLSAFGRVSELVKMERDVLGSVIVYAGAGGLLSLAAPVGVQLLVNSVAFGGTAQPLVVLSVLVVIALGFAAVIHAFQVRLVEKLQERVFARVAVDFAHRLPRMLHASFLNHGGRDLTARFLDVVTLQKGLASLLLDAAGVVLQVISGSLLLAFYHPTLLAFAVILVACATFVFVVLGRGGAETSIKESKAKFAFVDWLGVIADQHTFFKTRDNESIATTHARELVLEYLEARRKHFGVVFRQTVGFLSIQALATAALLLVGGALVLQGNLTLGQLIASEFVVTATVTGLSKFGKYLENFYDLVAALDKLAAVHEVELEKPDGIALPLSPEGTKLEMEEPGLDHGTAANVGSLVPSGGWGSVFGSRVALRRIGDALLSPSEGGGDYRFIADGAPIDKVNPASLHNQTFVLSGSPYRGLSIDSILSSGGHRPGIEESRPVLARVGLLDVLDKNPDALRVPIEALGLGARDILALDVARAVTHRPRLLIVDGAFDGEVAAPGLLQVLREELPKTTLLVLTSDPRIHELAETRLKVGEKGALV